MERAMRADPGKITEDGLVQTADGKTYDMSQHDAGKSVSMVDGNLVLMFEGLEQPIIIEQHFEGDQPLRFADGEHSPKSLSEMLNIEIKIQDESGQVYTKYLSSDAGSIHLLQGEKLLTTPEQLTTQDSGDGGIQLIRLANGNVLEINTLREEVNNNRETVFTSNESTDVVRQVETETDDSQESSQNEKVVKGNLVTEQAEQEVDGSSAKHESAHQDDYSNPINGAPIIIVINQLFYQPIILSTATFERRNI